ncbi:hypothetical protein AMIS_34020 [Actinoplanes missouriensis 431]|uniref:Uncharacterized protein n=1 Tax=Actinoplanes missouriensis (strain ATCC 14538 / DSM 43046 / CBS 188.64 / JCM 3121 / NBRC 102363 / NCIMB 12654 / NRRL B-3342 / UNCC 431) TaxID=512565 RepID=I0H6I5_ACTM4|nr:hypothetical protein [Actinoplanes missouriensis]BAL88622.1 hypothetical protein AMIS_34020 [Actinoplanes missouriensis 431]
MTELLRSLDDEPDTPSTVDVRRAIATARRTRRVRRGVTGAGAAVVTVAASLAGFTLTRPAAAPAPVAPATTAAPTGAPRPSAAAPPALTRCAISRLPVPDRAPMALVTAADPTGEWIAGRTYPKSGGYQAVLWHAGTVTKVMLPGDLEEALRDVNASGTAVGWSYTEDGPVPYAYRNGKITKLAPSGSALGINDAGRIVGDDDEGNAVVWESAGATPSRLPAPSSAKTVQARAIDLDGTIVGSLDLGIPYIWLPDGTHRRMPMPEIDGKPAAVAQAFDIRNGWVTGMAAMKPDKGSRGNAPAYAVRWNLRTGESELVGELQYPADAVNPFGWQVGTDRDGYAVLLTGEKTIRLPDLAKHRADGTATIASTLSDDGRIIAGQSDDRTDTIQAVVWRCR